MNYLDQYDETAVIKQDQARSCEVESHTSRIGVIKSDVDIDANDMNNNNSDISKGHQLGKDSKVDSGSNRKPIEIKISQEDSTSQLEKCPNSEENHEVWFQRPEPSKDSKPYLWDYKNCENWSEHFPDAKGNHQSPIDILTSLAVFDEKLSKSPVELNFDPNSFVEIRNMNHTFVVSGPSSDSLVGGCGLSDKFRFAQFHMHWGATDEIGSEHLIDGKSFSAEIHFVNWNCTKYTKFEDAFLSNNHDGLLVFGVFVKIGKENPAFEKLAELTDSIKLKDQTAEISKEFNIHKLFPNDLSRYWTYPGSLTAPPCSQSVKWVVLAEPIEVSSKQLNRFRGLHSCCHASECGEGNRIAFNFRPTSQVNQRTVYKSFH